jgi:hypothetical protein
MKKRTVITTEKHEVWVIRRADECPPASNDAPRGDASPSETHAPAVSKHPESERKEGSDDEK